MQLTVVIPAYNEARRLPAYLREVTDYFEKAKIQAEVIVVDDGSTDSIAEVLREQSRTPGLRLLAHAKNLGKGAAVCSGIKAAQGKLVLFTDADGATPIAQEYSLRSQIEQGGADVAIGSRHLGKSQVSRTLLRKLASVLFQHAVRYNFALPFTDTQCGFKMIRKGPARLLISRIREKRFLFDVEFLYWAKRLKLRIAEVPVSWSECRGSRVRLVRDGATMLVGLYRLRRRLETDQGFDQDSPQSCIHYESYAVQPDRKP